MIKEIQESNLKEIRKAHKLMNKNVKGLLKDGQTGPDAAMEELVYCYVNAAAAYVFWYRASFNRDGQAFISLSEDVQKGWMMTVVYLFSENKRAILDHLAKAPQEEIDNG